MKPQRSITPNEKLYIVGDAITRSFSLQLVLEMSDEVDISSLNQAIFQANTGNPNVPLRAHLGLINSFWYQSKEDLMNANCVELIEAEWDGQEMQTVPFLRSEGFQPLQATTHIYVIKGKRHFIVFRAFHGLMDAMGLYHWVKDIFRAWRNQPLLGSQASITDYHFLKNKKKNIHRPHFGFDCLAPTGQTGTIHTDYLWHKVSFPGKITGLTAKLCQIVLDYGVDFGVEKARFMIPVDLRSHLPDVNTTANFANPLFVEAQKGDHWQLIHSDIVKQLSNHNELMVGKHDDWLLYMPVSLLKWFFKALCDYQTKKNRYMLSSIVSKITIDLFDLATPHAKAIAGYFLPINIPLSPMTIIATDHHQETTVCFSVSNAHATQEQCMDLMNRIKKLGETECSPKINGEQRYCDALWNSYNDTAVDYPQDRSIFSIIWDNCLTYKNEKALIINELEFITYEGLKNKVLDIASHFSSLGVQSGSRVAIVLPGNDDHLCSMLACWYLGAAYIPIDTRSPLTWTLTLLEDAKPTLTVHDNRVDSSVHYSSLCTTIPAQIEGVKRPEISSNSLSQLAYIIYTSGSTGRPKGVMINHGQLLNYLLWAVDVYRYNGLSYHTALVTSLAFDLSVTPLYLPLMTGGSIALFTHPLTPLSMKNMLTHKAFNFIKLTPSHLRMVSGLSMHSDNPLTLVVGGESLPCQLAKSIIDKLPAARLFNEYGPTETTVGCMIHQYNPITDRQGSVPIGIPSANTRIYCLDSHLKPVKIGQEGELYISGKNVAVGYLNNADATNARFLPDPFDPKQRMYQSGDLAKHQADGLLVYLGRQDHQVKIRGHRIETSEIENALLTIEGISQVVVHFIKSGNALDDDVDELVAYLVSNTVMNTSVIRKKLSSVLPHYMLPKYCIFLAELPLTINGKVDVKKLPKPKITSTTGLREEHVDLLMHVRQLFANALSLQETDIDNHRTFEEMGGDSMQLAYIIREILNNMIAPQYHADFGQVLEQLLTRATPNNFYEALSIVRNES